MPRVGGFTCVDATQPSHLPACLLDPPSPLPIPCSQPPPLSPSPGLSLPPLRCGTMTPFPPPSLSRPAMLNPTYFALAPFCSPQVWDSDPFPPPLFPPSGVGQ